MLLMTYVKTGDDETWPLRQHRQHRLRSYWRLGRRFSSQTELARLQRFCSEPGSGSVSRTWLLTVVRVGFVRDAPGGAGRPGLGEILATIHPSETSHLL